MLITLALLPTAAAYDPADLDQLLTTNACPFCDLVAAPLDGLDLTGANLESANMRSAELQDTVLDGARLYRTDLRYAAGWGASFVDAELEMADLSDAHFDHANFSLAHMRSVVAARASFDVAVFDLAVMESMDITDAWMPGADLDRAIAPLLYSSGGTELRGATMNRGDFTGATLRDCSMISVEMDSTASRIDLRGTDLSFADLSYASLVNANMEDATILETKLNHTDMTGVQFNLTDFHGAEMQGVILRFGSISKMGLEQYDLSDSDFEGADMSWAGLWGTVDLTGANLRNADLTSSNMNGATLTGANIEGTIFQHTQFGSGTADDLDWNLPATGLADFYSVSGTSFQRITCTFCVIPSGEKGQADYTDATLTGATFSDMIIEPLVLANATRRLILDGADLTDLYAPAVDMTEVSMEGANLTGANLTGCTLRDGDLGGAMLDGATLDGCRLEGTPMDGVAAISKPLSCVDCELGDDPDGEPSVLDLQGAFLPYADFSGLTDDTTSGGLVDAEGLSAPGADFTGVDVHLADFRGADLADATITADATQISFAEADLTDASFSLLSRATVGYCETTMPDGSSHTDWPSSMDSELGLCNTGRSR